MSFADPSWWHLAWIVAAVLALRWFLVGHRTERVSTLVLWRRLLAESPARARGRLRPDAETALEAVLGVVLVALVAGPRWRGVEEAPAWIVVDAGAAMSAPSRRAVAERVVAAAGEGATVDRTADVPRSLATARGRRGRRVVLVADLVETAVPDDVAVVIAGDPVPNVGITAAEAHGGDGDGGVNVFLVIESSGPAGRVGLEITRRGERLLTADADVEPGAPAHLAVAVPGREGFTVSLETDLDDAIAADDVVELLPPSATGPAGVAPGLDAFADALVSLGLPAVELSNDEPLPGAGLHVGGRCPGPGDRAILVPPAAGAPLRLGDEVPGGELASAHPVFDGVPLATLPVAGFREVVGGSPLLHVGDRTAAALSTDGRVVVLGFDPAPRELTERPAFVLLVRALAEAVGHAGGPSRGWRARGLLDREETLARATPAAAQPGAGATDTVVERSLRPWAAVSALVLLAGLAALRRARRARASGSSRSPPPR